MSSVPCGIGKRGGGIDTSTFYHSRYNWNRSKVKVSARRASAGKTFEADSPTSRSASRKTIWERDGGLQLDETDHASSVRPEANYHEVFTGHWIWAQNADRVREVPRWARRHGRPGGGTRCTSYCGSCRCSPRSYTEHRES